MASPTARSVADTTLPGQIGRFVPSQCLGRGAQGIVYQAHDPELGREVAIKTLKRLSKDDTLLKNEARNVSNLQHQCIVPLYEIGQHDGSPYLVYRLEEGVSLRSLLDQGEALKEIRACEIFIQLLEAINYAHQQGILHRDLKPNNILIDSKDTPHILDFGVSAVIGNPDTKTDLVGSANYMAPETLSNAVVEQNSDIFSLSVIFHEMLTGKNLFTANNQKAVIYKILNEPVLGPSNFNRRINKKLDSIVMKGLERAPADRYRSCSQMKQALETYLGKDKVDVPIVDNTQGKKGALEFLLRKINRQPDFPAISKHISEITRKTANIDHNDTGELSQIILQDYALTTKLLRLVNSATYGQYGGQTTTVSRAVVILGYKQVRLAALSIMLFEHLSNANQASALKDSACTSFMSGVISRHLASGDKELDVEEVFIASMFHRLGKHLTIYYFPEEYAEIESLISNRGKAENVASHEVLGVAYQELGCAIAKEWQLPDNITSCMRPASSGTIKASKNKQERIAQLSALSNEISHIVATQDKDENHEAMEQLCERYKKLLHTTPKKINNILKDSIKEVTDYADILKFDVRSSQFFKKIVTDYSEPEEHTADSNNPLQQAVNSARNPARGSEQEQQEALHSIQEHTMLFINGISEITEALLSDYEINQIITMVLETIYRGMGFTRVMFCIRDNRNQGIVARFGLGKEIEDIIPQFHCPLEKNADDLFNTAISRHKDFVVLDVNSAEYRMRIPNWCRNLTEPHSMMLFPVIVNKTSIGLIYADNDRENPRVSSDTLRFFGTLRNQVTLAIQQKQKHR